MAESSRFRVAAGQLGPVPESELRTETLERLIVLLRGAARSGAELIVFPELALTPFFPRRLGDPAEIPAYFERDMPSLAVKPLFEEAKRLGVGFYLGYGEEVEANGCISYYNSAVLVSRTGTVVGKYQKIHIPGLLGTDDPRGGTADASLRFDGNSANFEKRYFSKGTLGFPVYGFRGIRAGMAICNDRRWPETYRMLALNGAQIALIGYSTMARRRLVAGGIVKNEPGHLALFHSHLVMQAGAYQNALWVVAAARAGEEDGGHLIGGSCIIAPSGEIVAQAHTHEDELVTAVCDPTYCDLYLNSVWNFDRERRIEEYGGITSRTHWSEG